MASSAFLLHTADTCGTLPQHLTWYVPAPRQTMRPCRPAGLPTRPETLAYMPRCIAPTPCSCVRLLIRCAVAASPLSAQMDCNHNLQTDPWGVELFYRKEQVVLSDETCIDDGGNMELGG